MSTFFLRKKVVKGLSLLLAVCVVALCLSYAAFIAQTASVDVNVWFYFLVSEDTHVEAGAEFVKLDGGAGYLLQMDGKDYVVLSVYLEENDGQAVQETLAKQGKTTRILSVGIEKLYLKFPKDKKKANIYVGAFRCLRSYMKILTETVSHLENGGTQESCKRILHPLERQLSFLSDQYDKTYPVFAKVCKQTAETLAQMRGETVYVRDLRYLLCGLAERSVSLASKFSL